MPLYEYICRNCGNRVEVMRRMSERTDAPACQKCGEETTLALSASAFLGAGTGGGNACSTSTWTGGG